MDTFTKMLRTVATFSLLSGVSGAMIGCGGNDAIESTPDIVGKADAPGTKYALLVDVTETQKNNASGKTKPLRMRLAATASLEDVDGKLQLAVKPCRILVPTTDPDYQPKIADKLLQSMDFVVPAQLATEGDKTTLKTDRGAFAIGVKLANVVSDPLPESKRSSLLYDQDQDGKLGVSMTVDTPIGNKAMYIAMRSSFALAGEAAEGGGYKGTSAFGLDLQIYDDTIPFIDARERGEKETRENTTSRTGDSFKMVALTGDDTTCKGAIKLLK